MKAIIDGLKYDTKYATKIGGNDNLGRGVDSSTDFKFWEAELYVTVRGRFFLAGEGGPMSMFSRPVGQNSWSGGSCIIPMTAEEALLWAEQNLDVETVEKYFSKTIKPA